MKRFILLIVIGLLKMQTMAVSPDSLTGRSGDSLSFSGQLSAWALYHNDKAMPLWAGARYLPQLDYQLSLPHDRLLDFELSLNINGTAGFKPFTNNITDGVIKLYRGWVRYSGENFEVRAGLQKINFGSASILRPLMWFDRLDPRDPLQLTDGVWGLLGRYYFLNNVNIWVWGLYGNNKPSVWDIVPTNKHIPEVGGRVQFPVPRGEMGLSYNHRTADSRRLGETIDNDIWAQFNKIPEDRFGIDGKWDMEVGLWFEATFTHKTKNLDIFTNQQLLNIGTDYTFGIGNGLNVVVEHLLMSNDINAFDFKHPVNFTGTSISYPLGMFDNVNTIVYYDWFSKTFYNFLSWKKQFNNITLYSMLFLNPEVNHLPMNDDINNILGGKGIQFMIVYNH
jgi:hypothetical protein